jgi:hypothetical protein
MEGKFDTNVLSRLPSKSRVASRIIIVLVPLGIIERLVDPGRTKRLSIE